MLKSQKAVVKQARSGKAAHAQVVIAEKRERMIAEAAYYLAEKRDFAAGDRLTDWIEAEAEIDKRLTGQGARSAAAHAG